MDVVSGVSFKETLSSDGPSMCTGLRRSKDPVSSRPFKSSLKYFVSLDNTQKGSW